MNKRPAYDTRKGNRFFVDEKMKKFAKKLANEAFSCLPEVISQQEFDDAWERVEATLDDYAAGNRVLHERGFNTALNVAIKFIEKNRWKVSANYYFIRIERESVFRDETWTKYAFELFNVYENWLSDIQEKGFSQSIEQALADFFLSAIFHSGVCDASRLLAIVNAMTNLRLSAFNQMPYLPYTVPDVQTKITNQIDGEGYRQHVGMCFLAPPTLALMNHLLKQKPKAYPNNLAELYELLRQRCGYIFSSKKLKSAIFITENLTKLTQP